MNRLFTKLPFDGWHIDSFGEAEAWDYNGKKIDFVASFPDFINAAHQALQRPVVLNTVSGAGQEGIVSSAAEFVYSELWLPDHPTYSSILQSADSIHRANLNKAIVFAAYMQNGAAEKLTLEGKHAAFNLPGLLIADAAIFAYGASHIELGDGDRMLSREQTYPRWMNGTDIYLSQSLSNNAVHYQTYRILARMARTLGKDGSAYDRRAMRIKRSINQILWMHDKGYYGEYLYGRAHPVLSPRVDSLGESLTMLFEIATPAQQKVMLKNLPQLDYGIPTVYPRTPSIPPYHNESVWPFVQAFWNLAAAKSHEDAIVADGLSVLLRHTSFFLTNKENLVGNTGSPMGTEINSDRQLWSIAGNLAMIYRILFGMNFQAGGIHLAPFIPTDFAGSYQLDGLRFRQATLSIRVSGSGSRIHTQTLDGKPFNGTIPTALRGPHHVNLILPGTDDRATTPHHSEDITAPDTPVLRIEQKKLVLGHSTCALESCGF